MSNRGIISAQISVRLAAEKSEKLPVRMHPVRHRKAPAKRLGSPSLSVRSTSIRNAVRRGRNNCTGGNTPSRTLRL